MTQLRKVAVSVGDLNGIGIQLALQNHNTICRFVDPLYCIDKGMLEQAAQKLKFSIPNNFHTIENIAPAFNIAPGEVNSKSGTYAYASFKKAVGLAKDQKVDAICTLPIHKEAWKKAGVHYKGHTDALRDFFNKEAIMMLGSKNMYIALFTEHIPLRDVASKINEKDLTRFFVNFYHAIRPESTVAVLGLNPHAGDNGVLGNEEIVIKKAIDHATKIIEEKNPSIFTSPMVPDVAFTPNVRKNYKYYIAMYHDQGLTPLKALFFDESINISLNLPILRTSVDHGTAFDIAYKGVKLNHQSYLNAIGYITKHLKNY